MNPTLAALPLLPLLAGCAFPKTVSLFEGPPGGDRASAEARVLVLPVADSRSDPHALGAEFTEDSFFNSCFCLGAKVAQDEHAARSDRPLGDLVADALVRQADAAGLPSRALDADRVPAGDPVLLKARILSFSCRTRTRMAVARVLGSEEDARLELELEVSEGAENLWKGSAVAERKALRGEGEPPAGSLAEAARGQGEPIPATEISALARELVREAVEKLARQGAFDGILSREHAACDALLAEAARMEKEGSHLAALKRAEAALSRAVGDRRARAFSQMARAYRAAPVKPAFPEEARRHDVLGYDALTGRRYDDAILEYGRVAAIAPWWPQARLNLAEALAERQRFAEAADHARRYLELSPDAPEARDVLDKLYLWENKAKAGR